MDPRTVPQHIHRSHDALRYYEAESDAGHSFEYDPDEDDSNLSRKPITGCEHQKINLVAMIQWDHAGGPVLQTSDGPLHWLGWRDRILLRLRVLTVHELNALVVAGLRDKH